jgi:O-antigen/teichoic acid export membrane protein
MKVRLLAVQHLVITSKWTVVTACGGVLFGVVDRLIVSHFMGVKAVATYAIMVQLTMLSHSLNGAMMSVLLPRIGSVNAINTRTAATQVQHLVKVAFAFALLFNLAVATVIVFAGNNLLKVWLGANTFFFAESVWTAFAIAAALLSAAVVPHFVLMAKNQTRLLGVTNISAGFLSMGAMVVAASYSNWMMLGAAKALYGGVLLLNIFVVFSIVFKKKE